MTIAHVLLTHWHIDHTSGVPDLLAYRPELADRIFKYDPDRGQQPIRDGQVFRVEGATLRAVHTPGHSHDHMCFLMEEEAALFTGDNVLGHGQSVFEDLGLFTTALSRMAQLDCRLGYPAHGDVIRDLPRKMRDLVRQKEYHERQLHSVLAAAKHRALESGTGGKGSLSVPELVGSLYGQVDRDVFKLAVEPQVLKTLDKLAEDRRVAFEIVAGEKRWFAREAQARGQRRRLRGGRTDVVPV